MSRRVWQFLMRLTGCRAEDGLETYDTNQAWVTYSYRWTDRALDLFGRTFVLATCCICGEREDLMVKESEAVPGGHHPKRTAFLDAHQHPGVNRNPLSWALPLRNPAALQEGDLEDVLGVAMHRAQREAREDQP